jgi:hypothetical protein
MRARSDPLNGRHILVDKGGIEARQPNDLDDLRVGDPADMRAEG